MKKRILFVDSNAQELQELESLLADQRGVWDLVLVKTAAEAFDALAQAPYDAAVADLKLSDQGGVEFMNRVLDQYPAVHRLMLANLEEKDAALKCIGTAHQFLAKPCDAKRLKAALSRAFEADAWMPKEAARKLISQMTKLPSPPYIYFRVLRELRASEPSLEVIGSLIARDPAMSAKLLQLANSASLGLVIEVANPAEAVMYLGLETTQALLLLAHGCSFFEQVKEARFSVDQLWNHSIRTGHFAQYIAKAEKAETSIMEEAFTAGLLHDIGKLALAANHPNTFREAIQMARAKNLTEWDAEQTVFGSNHAEVGGCLLATWGLPWRIVEAVALHHHPVQLGTQAFCPLTAVHVGNVMERVVSGDRRPPPVDTAYLEQIGLTDRLEEWKTLCAMKAGG